MENCDTKCGFAALIGRPNVGKSTLINNILGQKLSIVTSKPQTTRNRVLAVHNEGDAQVIFLDTPGIHRPSGSLGRYMVEAAEGAIKEADVVVWLIDATAHSKNPGMRPEERAVADLLTEDGTPTIALINKVDLVKNKDLLLPLIQEVSSVSVVEEIIPLSALTGDGVEILLGELTARLPESPKLYPEDLLSDQAERFFVAELIREALMDLTRQEIPYGAAVVVERFVEETERVVVHAVIHVEKDSQKGIVVGKGGRMIKEIGTRARTEAERLMGCPVDLRLHVNVSPGWTKTDDGLKRMGYE